MIVKFRQFSETRNSFNRLKMCNFVIDIYRDCETSVCNLKKVFRSDKSRLCLTSRNASTNCRHFEMFEILLESCWIIETVNVLLEVWANEMATRYISVAVSSVFVNAMTVNLVNIDR